jgi:hypothetical protein
MACSAHRVRIARRVSWFEARLAMMTTKGTTISCFWYSTVVHLAGLAPSRRRIDARGASSGDGGGGSARAMAVLEDTSDQRQSPPFGGARSFVSLKYTGMSGSLKKPLNCIIYIYI